MKISVIILCCMMLSDQTFAETTSINIDHSNNNQSIVWCVLGIGLIAALFMRESKPLTMQDNTDKENTYSYKSLSNTQNYTYDKDTNTYKISSETVQQQTVEEKSNYPRQRSYDFYGDSVKKKTGNLPVYEVDCQLESNYDYNGKEISKSKVCRPKIIGYQ